MPPVSLTDFTLFAGLLAGLASSLHCVGMCGGIASSLMIGMSPSDDGVARAQTLLLSQLGRVTGYVLAGGVLGALGSNTYLLFDHGEAYALLRWLGGLTLVYIGLSVAGWAPSLAGLDRLTHGLSGVFARLGTGPVAQASPLFAGLVWGFVPCGMVYAALFYAMLSGSAVTGALIMAGFGLGTLPAVMSSAWGAGVFVRWARQARHRIGVGLAIVALGVVSAIMPWKTIAALCGIPVS